MPHMRFNICMKYCSEKKLIDFICSRTDSGTVSCRMGGGRRNGLGFRRPRVLVPILTLVKNQPAALGLSVLI